MQTHRTLSSILFLALAASPVLLPAQFKTPSSDELNMKDNPKVPGAAAVFLDVEQITDDPLHLYTFYARIKVLKPEGKSLATVEIPIHVGDSGVRSVKPKIAHQDWIADSPTAPQAQFKIAEIKARTIRPDGSVVPLAVKPEDVVPVKSPDGLSNHLAFTLAGVEPGSILEYRYTLRYDENHFSSPFWQVQQPYFVKRAHYAFTPFNDFLTDQQSMTDRYLIDAHGKVVNTIIWSPVLPAGAAVKTESTGRFTLDLTDIPPLPSEEWMPPAQSLSFHVRFYYKNAFSGNEFWTNEDNRWSKEVDRLAEPTASIKQAVAGLVASGDDDLGKAAKLMKAVQAIDNTDFHPDALPVRLDQPDLRVPSRAEEVWARKSGSSEEVSLLYLAMLRAAGLAAYDMKVVDRDKGVFSSAYLSFDQFDSDLIILDLHGKDIFLDPGQTMCPFQALHWKHAGASGVRQTATGTAVATSPLLPYSANSLLRAGDITFDDPSHFSGYFRFVMTGQDALLWRQMTLTSGIDTVKLRFDQWLQTMVPHGVQAHFDHFLGLDDPGSNLIAIVNAEGSPASPSAGRYALPAVFFEAAGNPLFPNDAQRKQSIDMHYAGQVADQVVYHLPPGLNVESAPPNSNLSLERYAAFASNTHIDAGQIKTSRTLARAFTLASPAEYPSLRDFYQKVAAGDRQQIILTVTTATQGQ